jgi:hypothetical protein
MRLICTGILVCLLVGCNDSAGKNNERAKAVEPVIKTAPAADQAAKPATESAAAAPAGQVASATPASSAAEAQPAATPKSPLDEIIDKYVESGIDGVVDVTTDKNGVITKVVVVGTAPISTVLGAADGLLTARKEARLRAAGKFRQFLKEKVSIEEKTETERVVKLESKGGGDLAESGQKISKNTEKYSTVSEGMVRGLQVLGYKTVSLNKSEKVYVMVCGWDADTSKAVTGLEKQLDSDEASGGAAAGSGSAEDRRQLPDQSKVSPGASKFFQKKPEKPDKP